MSSEPSLIDELWDSLVTAVIEAAAGLWWLLRHPWMLGTVLVAAGVIVVGGWRPASWSSASLRPS